MKFKFTIARKLGLGFGILTLAILSLSTFTYLNLQKNRNLSDNIREIYTPSVSQLNDLTMTISNSKMLIKTWVFIEKKPDTPDKMRLKSLHESTYPEIISELQELSNAWEPKQRQKLDSIATTIEDTLFEKHKYIMGQLNTFDAYDEGMIIFEIQMMVENGGEVIRITDRVINELNTLLTDIENEAKESTAEMIRSSDKFLYWIQFLAVSLFILAVIIAFTTIKSIISPINSLKKTLILMSKGILPDKKLKIRNDEIGEMAYALNNFIKSLRKTSEFSMEIGKGNFSYEFKPLSKEDTLGNSLLDMRENLKEAARKENIRKKEDEQRNWGTRGLAQFADILRKNNDDLEKLSYTIISNLVKYLDANQGGMFIIQDEDQGDLKLELYAAYAYERKKFLKKTIDKGEGVVGTCLVEKQTIYMTDIPDSYLNITSGLGKANPRSLLVVPLKVNEEIFGVLEIASFNKFEPYQIEFTEKVGESIASTISSVKISTRTAKLLQESKEQSEQLIQQEEEMRQNLEELQSTQEEADRRIKELENQLSYFDETVGIFEIDLEGNILYANDFFAQMLNLTPDEIIDKNHPILISPDHIRMEKYQNMLVDFKNGIHHHTENVYETPKGKVWLHESYTPIRDIEGSVEKVMVVTVDVTKAVKETNPKEGK